MTGLPQAGLGKELGFPLVHHPDYLSPAAPGATHSFDKYGLVMQALGELGARPAIHRAEPMPRAWIEAVHDPAYVEEVLTLTVPRDKARRIGFPITERIARRSTLALGGTWRAAKLALSHGYAANSAGGSHHALWDTGAGYCVFNDLAVAAHRLLAEGDARRVLILDLDVHQGDGTASLLAGRPEVFTLSIHAERNFPVRKARSTLDVALPDGTADDAYLAALRHALLPALASFRPDLILYQAGVDVHADDRARSAGSDGRRAGGARPFGGGQLRGGRDPARERAGRRYAHDRMAPARRHARSILTLADAYRHARGH